MLEGDTRPLRHPARQYLVVHEMTHLIEATHNRRFVDLMDRIIPQWRV